MSRYTIVLLSLLTILPARANLGENVKELITRYGSPVNYSEANPKFPFGTIVFSSAGITLVVFLVGDKEVGARVSKTNNSSFSDAERQGIMGADTGGSHWVSVPGADPNTLEWTRSDNAKVMYDKQKNMLIFTSEEMDKVLKSAQSAAPAPAPATNAAAPVAPVR